MKNNGITLVEVLVSVVIVSISLFALINYYHIHQRAAEKRTRLTRSIFLAQDIREESSIKPFSDPDFPGYFGREPGELTAKRIRLNDFDDYNQLDENPPQDIKGNNIKSFEHFRRKMTVVPYRLSNEFPPNRYDYLMAAVDIYYNEDKVYSLSWIRTKDEAY